jgi:hypothetical protein
MSVPDELKREFYMTIPQLLAQQTKYMKTANAEIATELRNIRMHLRSLLVLVSLIGGVWLGVVLYFVVVA